MGRTHDRRGRGGDSGSHLRCVAASSSAEASVDRMADQGATTEDRPRKARAWPVHSAQLIPEATAPHPTPRHPAGVPSQERERRGSETCGQPRPTGFWSRRSRSGCRPNAYVPIPFGREAREGRGNRQNRSRSGMSVTLSQTGAPGICGVAVLASDMARSDGKGQPVSAGCPSLVRADGPLAVRSVARWHLAR